MSSTLQQLLAHRDAKPKPPASKTEINRIKQRFQGEIPELLIDFWQQSNGLVFKRFNAELFGLPEVLDLIEKDYWSCYGVGEVIPIFDNHQSDYFVVCLNEPVTNRILSTPHDSDTRFVYRSLETFFAEILAGLHSDTNADLFFYDRNDDFRPDTPRTPDDQIAARTFLAKPAGEYNWILAIPLLDDSEPELWRKVLESDRFGVRPAALRYLRQMTSPRLKALYEQDQRELAIFCDQAEQAVIKAGLPLKERKENSLNINGRWQGLDGWFTLRNDPDVFKLLTDPRRYE